MLEVSYRSRYIEEAVDESEVGAFCITNIPLPKVTNWLFQASRDESWRL